MEEDDYEQQRHHSEQVERARNELISYYSSAMLGVNRLAGGKLLSIDQMSDEEILAEARKIGFRMPDRDEY